MYEKLIDPFLMKHLLVYDPWNEEPNETNILKNLGLNEEITIDEMTIEANLTEKQRYIIIAYYQEDMTLQEIGEALNITKQAVFKTRVRALKRIEQWVKKSAKI